MLKRQFIHFLGLFLPDFRFSFCFSAEIAVILSNSFAFLSNSGRRKYLIWEPRMKTDSILLIIPFLARWVTPRNSQFIFSYLPWYVCLRTLFNGARILTSECESIPLNVSLLISSTVTTCPSASCNILIVAEMIGFLNAIVLSKKKDFCEREIKSKFILAQLWLDVSLHLRWRQKNQFIHQKTYKKTVFNCNLLI